MPCNMREYSCYDMFSALGAEMIHNKVRFRQLKYICYIAILDIVYLSLCLFLFLHHTEKISCQEKILLLFANIVPTIILNVFYIKKNNYKKLCEEEHAFFTETLERLACKNQVDFLLQEICGEDYDND